jgi:acylphosphatase
MSTDENARIHCFVAGHVQGVGFRAFALEHAVDMDLTGWVRNTFDGEVEIVAEGPRNILEALCDYLNKGPRGAFISEVRREWGEYSGEFTRFEVRRTT